MQKQDKLPKCYTLLTKTKKRKEVQYFISITCCNKKAFLTSAYSFDSYHILIWAMWHSDKVLTIFYSICQDCPKRHIYIYMHCGRPNRKHLLIRKSYNQKSEPASYQIKTYLHEGSCGLVVFWYDGQPLICYALPWSVLHMIHNNAVLHTA